MTTTERAIVTRNGPDLVVTIAHQAHTASCKYRQCGQEIAVVRGHRRREYCNDACRQAEHRARLDDAERTRQEAARVAQEVSEVETTKQQYGPDLSPQTLQLLRAIWQRYGSALLHEVGTAIIREREPLRNTHALDQAHHTELQAAYHEAIMTIAARERTIEQQKNRIGKQNMQHQGRAPEVERMQQDMRALRQELARTQEEYHTLTNVLYDRKMELHNARQRIQELEQLRTYRDDLITDRSVLDARLMALGEAVQYRRLINADTHIAPGAEELVNDLKGEQVLRVLLTFGGKPQQFSEGKEEKLKSSRSQKQRCEMK